MQGQCAESLGNTICVVTYILQCSAKICGTALHTNNSPNNHDNWQHQTDRSRGQTMIQAYIFTCSLKLSTDTF